MISLYILEHVIPEYICFTYFSALKFGYDTFERTVVNVRLLKHSQQFTGYWAYKLKVKL